MCSCQKKNLSKVIQDTPVFAMPSESINRWGPIIWKMLHIVGARIGQHIAVDDHRTSQHIKAIVDALPNIIPCPDCQDHARLYIETNPFLPVGKTRGDLNLYVASYLFEFHNDVRRRKEQPILVNTVEESQTLYKKQTITHLDDQTLATYFRLAIKYQIIRADTYTHWNMKLKNLRSLLFMK